MKKGGKIAITLGALAGAGALAYYLFFKKDSTIYILKNKDDTDSGDVNGNDDSGGGGGGGGGSTRFNEPSPFTSKLEVELFQNYVLDVIKNKTILGNAGADGWWGINTHKAWVKYSDKYKEYQKTHLLDGVGGTPDISSSASNFQAFIINVGSEGLNYKIISKVLKIRLHSTNSKMKNYYYQIAFNEQGFWAIAMSKGSSTGGFNSLASGTYNLTGSPRLKVTAVQDNSGSLYVGYEAGGTGKVITPIRKLIQRHWKDYGMTNALAQTLNSYSW